MQNKRDQLQAYRFVMARLISALVQGEPDAAETPMRRSKTGVVISTILALLVLAGFGVYGLVVRGGNTAWREPGTIIVEKETGTRYLWLDGALRPVLNYTSAVLAAGGQRSAVRTVSRASLTGLPHGRPIGIPGAPDDVPAPGRLLTGAWLVCAPLTANLQGAMTPAIVVSLGDATEVKPFDENEAALVRGGDGTQYVIWRDQRMKAPDARTLMALGFGAVPPLAVDSAWLNAFREGPDLRADVAAGLGQTGPLIAGRQSRVGQVFAVAAPGGGLTHYLMRQDGVAAVSATEAALHLAAPEVATAYQEQPVAIIEVTPSQLAATPRSSAAARRFDLPAQPLTPRGDVTQDDQVLCARTSFSQDGEVSARPVLVHKGLLGAVPAPKPGEEDTRVADAVLVPPGTGALLAAHAGPGVPTGAVYLLTDLGTKYPLAPDVAGALGFGGVTGLSVPANLLAFLPTGPVLAAEPARVEQASR